MEDQLIEFETAKLAKEKGFDESTEYKFQYNEETFGVRREKGIPLSYASGCSQCSQPTQSLLQRWLREVHNIEVEPKLNDKLYRRLYEKAYGKVALNYHWVIITGINDPNYFYENFYASETYETYEEAFEKGLVEGLKLIK